PLVRSIQMTRSSCFFSLIAPPPPELYTLSLHDALPISAPVRSDRPIDVRSRSRSRPTRDVNVAPSQRTRRSPGVAAPPSRGTSRSEEHTSELQSRENLVCRLLLEKKKRKRQRMRREAKE